MHGFTIPAVSSTPERAIADLRYSLDLPTKQPLSYFRHHLISHNSGYRPRAKLLRISLPRQPRQGVITDIQLNSPGRQSRGDLLDPQGDDVEYDRWRQFVEYEEFV